MIQLLVFPKPLDFGVFLSSFVIWGCFFFTLLSTLAHITDTHSSVLDGLRSTYDCDWLPGAMSSAVIGQEALSITVQREMRLWIRRLGGGERTRKGRKQCAPSISAYLRHTACRNEAKPVRGRGPSPSLRHCFTRTWTAELTQLYCTLVIFPARCGAEAARCEGRVVVDFCASPEIREGYVSRKRVT